MVMVVAAAVVVVAVMMRRWRGRGRWRCGGGRRINLGCECRKVGSIEEHNLRSRRTHVSLKWVCEIHMFQMFSVFRV